MKKQAIMSVLGLICSLVGQSAHCQNPAAGNPNAKTIVEVTHSRNGWTKPPPKLSGNYVTRGPILRKEVSKKTVNLGEERTTAKGSVSGKTTIITTTTTTLNVLPAGTGTRKQAIHADPIGVSIDNRGKSLVQTTSGASTSSGGMPRGGLINGNKSSSNKNTSQSNSNTQAATYATKYGDNYGQPRKRQY